MSISRRFMRALARGMLKGAFIGLLKPYKDRDLLWDIEHDVSLLSFLREEPELYRKVSKIILVGKDLIEDIGLNPEKVTTVDNILITLFEERYDLFRVLHTEKGRKWLKKNLEEFRREFL